MTDADELLEAMLTVAPDGDALDRLADMADHEEVEADDDDDAG